MKKHDYADVLIYVAAVAVLLLICLYFPCKTDLFRFKPESCMVTVARGESAAHFAHKLKTKKLISSERLTRVFMKLNGADKKLPVGTLALKADTASGMARQLATVKPQHFAVTLIPGKTLSENAKLNSLDFDKLTVALNCAENFPKELRAKLPKDIAARAVFLLPETYFLSTGATVENAVVREASRLWLQRVGKKAAVFDEQKLLRCGIMASIVEGEARVAADRPVLAGIFYRRLEIPMRLQSCATVVYCWKLKGQKKQRLTYADLKIESPFNTYTHDGLPPAPINIPSEASWNAALKPAKTEYLYFVADGNGKHIFSQNYAEHLQKQKGAGR